jgi:hypothetical protein
MDARHGCVLVHDDGRRRCTWIGSESESESDARPIEAASIYRSMCFGSSHGSETYPHE